MVNIQVPISEANLEFPKFKRSIPEFSKFEASKTNTDLQFMKDLADRGKFRTREGSRSDSGTVASFTPNQGETFYFLGGTWVFNTDGGGSVRLLNDGVVRERQNADTVNQTRGNWNLEGDSLIGNNSKAYTIELVNESGSSACSGSIFGYVEQSETLSSRGGM